MPAGHDLSLGVEAGIRTPPKKDLRFHRKSSGWAAIGAEATRQASIIARRVRQWAPAPLLVFLRQLVIKNKRGFRHSRAGVILIGKWCKNLIATTAGKFAANGLPWRLLSSMARSRAWSFASCPDDGFGWLGCRFA